MKKILLANSDLEVSQLGFGCVNLGSKIKEEKAFELLDYYLERGGNFLDTSNNYSFWVDGCDGGESERVIGAWLKRGIDRQGVTIATKLGALPKELGEKGFDNVRGFSREAILEQVEESLERLGTDYIDLLYLHIDDRSVDLEEALMTLAELRDKGVIRAYGASNFKAWRLEQARRICEEKAIPYFSTIQLRTSYLSPNAHSDFGVQEFFNNEHKDFIDYYKNITLVGYTILLWGAYSKGSIEDKRYISEENEEKLLEVQKVEDRNAWVLDWTANLLGGSIALCTTSSLDHLKSNIDYFSR